MIPLVGQACAIGDQRPFVSPSSCSTPRWRRRGRDRGSTPARWPSWPSIREVVAESSGGLAEVMAGFNNAERVKKVKVLADEWLPDSDEPAPTLLKRAATLAKYADAIEGIYADRAVGRRAGVRSGVRRVAGGGVYVELVVPSACGELPTTAPQTSASPTRSSTAGSAAAGASTWAKATTDPSRAYLHHRVVGGIAEPLRLVAPGGD